MKVQFRGGLWLGSLSADYCMLLKIGFFLSRFARYAIVVFFLKCFDIASILLCRGRA